MIDIIEDTIQKRLREIELFKGFDIDSFPAKGFEKYLFLNPKGCFLTMYQNSKMSDEESLYSVNSIETYNFIVFMGLRSLQTHKQANPYIQQLKTALNGLEILSKRLQVEEVNFELERSGDLWYSIPVTIDFWLVDEYKDQTEELPSLGGGAGERVGLGAH